MALIKTDSKHYEDIANSIRAGLNNEDTLKPNEMAEKINDVSALKDKKPYINSGTLKSLRFFFYGGFNSVDNLLPLMNTSSVQQWNYCFSQHLGITNISINTDRAVNITGLFEGSTTLVTVNMTSTARVTTGSRVFYNCQKLKTVSKLNYSKKTDNTTDFYNCYALVNIGFDEQSIPIDISFAYSNLLSLESLKSILFGLKNYAGTDNEFVYSIILHEDSWALLDADGATSPNGNSWRDYVTDIGWND